jgi:hypothetical protein
MSSIWKSLKKGGGCKNRTLFCHCCSLTKKRVHLARPIPCQSCVEKDRAKCATTIQWGILLHWQLPASVSCPCQSTTPSWPTEPLKND